MPDVAPAMFDDWQRTLRRTRARVRTAALRERTALRRRVVETERRESLTAVLVLAPLIGGVSWLSMVLEPIPFLLFPPLAAATYTLFAYPENPGHLPWPFPLALTAGATSGWAARSVARALFAPLPQGAFQVHPVTATLTVLFAGGFLWVFDTELAPAIAVGLLLPFAGVSGPVYVTNVLVASSLVAAVFAIWRRIHH